MRRYCLTSASALRMMVHAVPRALLRVAAWVASSHVAARQGRGSVDETSGRSRGGSEVNKSAQVGLYKAISTMEDTRRMGRPHPACSLNQATNRLVLMLMEGESSSAHGVVASVCLGEPDTP